MDKDSLNATKAAKSYHWSSKAVTAQKALRQAINTVFFVYSKENGSDSPESIVTSNKDGELRVQ